MSEYLKSARSRLGDRATVYALFDGEELFYVGCCAGLAHTRWLEHCRAKNPTPVSARIRKMAKAGTVPVVRVLERPLFRQRWACERRWVEWADRHGGFLENRTG